MTTLLLRAEKALKNAGAYTPERAEKLAISAALRAEKQEAYIASAAYRAGIDVWRAGLRAKAAEAARTEAEKAAALAAEQDRQQRVAVAAEAARVCREVPSQAQNVRAFMALVVNFETYDNYCRRSGIKREAAYQRVRRGALALEAYATPEVATWVRERARAWKR